MVFAKHVTHLLPTGTGFAFPPHIIISIVTSDQIDDNVTCTISILKILVNDLVHDVAMIRDDLVF